MQEAQNYLRFTGEPDDIERVTSGSEGGGWKSADTAIGNLLVVYPTVFSPPCA